MITTQIVREIVLELLRETGLLKPESPGLPVVFDCACTREGCRCTLSVAPRLIDGERAVHITVNNSFGVILTQPQRDQLADILNDKDWFGDHADLGK